MNENSVAYERGSRVRQDHSEREDDRAERARVVPLRDQPDDGGPVEQRCRARIRATRPDYKRRERERDPRRHLDRELAGRTGERPPRLVASHGHRNRRNREDRQHQKPAAPGHATTPGRNFATMRVPPLRRAVDGEGPAGRLDPYRETAEPRTSCGIRAAGTVIADDDVHHAAGFAHPDLEARGVRVLQRIGDCLRAREPHASLDFGWEALVRHGHRHRNACMLGELSEGGPEPAFVEHHRVEAAREAEELRAHLVDARDQVRLGVRGPELVGRLSKEGLHVGAQLRAEAATFGVRGVHQPSGGGLDVRDAGTYGRLELGVRDGHTQGSAWPHR